MADWSVSAEEKGPSFSKKDRDRLIHCNTDTLNTASYQILTFLFHDNSCIFSL